VGQNGPSPPYVKNFDYCNVGEFGEKKEGVREAGRGEERKNWVEMVFSLSGHEIHSYL
jgi:hypothetical protein